MTARHGATQVGGATNPSLGPLRGVGPWLAAFAVSIVFGMQSGEILRFLHVIGHTRTADWVDLPVPWVILALAAVVLWRAAARPGVWWLLVAGGAVFAEGHGIHLAANSIDNAEPGPTAHLWDEVVGHWVSFCGLAVVLVAVALALRGRSLTVHPLGWLLAALVGLTLFNTYIEGATPVLGFVVSVGFLAAGWLTRGQVLGRLLLATFGVTLLLLVGWGLYWGGFPEFSTLGWI